MKRVPVFSLQRGFTIVELLVVIVVIAILASIVIVAYNGMSQKARQSAAASAAESAVKKALSYASLNSDTLPPDLPTAGVNNDTNTIFEYTYDNTTKTYCVTATFQKVSYYISSTAPNPTAGLCSGHTGGAPPSDGSFIQTITSSNCPSTRIRGVDARDNRTYWIQKMADGKCWMLTNLAYQGSTSNGGVSTYGDTKTLSNGTADGASTYTVAKYYAPSGASPTQEPGLPSTSTNGTGQYGYLYNYCAAMGGQATAACANATTPAVDPTTTICPYGWRLPTGQATTGEFTLLNNAINGGSSTVETGMLNPWLGMHAGYWLNGTFTTQGTTGNYQSSTPYTNATDTYTMFHQTFNTKTAWIPSTAKLYGFSVRCVAN